MTQAAEWLTSQDMSSNQAAEQAEEMGPKIGAFTGAAECGQKCCPGHDGDEKMSTSEFFSGLVAEGGQHANDRKHRCGKSDKLMIWTMNNDIDQIGATGGKE